MTLDGVSAALCAEGRHQWVPVDVLRRPGLHRERCRGCGAHGVRMSPSDDARDTGRVLAR